jgi:nucleotide-binding universal stress UspA family protein
MGTTETQAPDNDHRTATFGDIVCGVNGSRADAETVRQAALLSGPEGRLDIVCVLDTKGYGPTEQANIARVRAQTAIEHARDTARELGVVPRTSILHGSSPWESLADAADGADLLVLGSRGGSRAGGIMLGSVATEAVHRAELPVLVARPTPGAPFPEQILLASDGSACSRVASEMAVTIALAHGSEITLFTADEGDTAARRDELAEQIAIAKFATGREPVAVTSPQPPRTAIVEYAVREQPSLVIVGSHGKTGIRALGSVSEHVTHHVPSSVLVARTARAAEEAR